MTAAAHPSGDPAGALTGAGATAAAPPPGTGTGSDPRAANARPSGSSGPRAVAGPWSLRPTLVVAVALVLGSLLFVAGAQAYLTQQSVRLTQIQAQLAVQVGEHRDFELRVAAALQPLARGQGGAESGSDRPEPGHRSHPR